MKTQDIFFRYSHHPFFFEQGQKSKNTCRYKVSFAIIYDMDLYYTCQTCGANLPEKPSAQKSVSCPECGSLNHAIERAQKTILEQLSELTVDIKPADINEALSTINTWFSEDVLNSQDLGITVKTSSERVTKYVAHVKRKTVGERTKEKGVFDYRLIEKIGEGGMGVIYLAEQSSLKRDVALKMTKESAKLTDSMLEHFLSEALVTSDFDHPNVVPIHDAGIDFKGQLFYAMKKVQGVTWDSLLHPKTEDEKQMAKDYSMNDHLNILNSVCNAVAFAHSRDIIHRDLKPSNVMIGEFGEVIVLDWGLAASIGPSEKVESIEELKTFGGTVLYMAPEMARVQKDEIGKHSDIYLLGAILYEILTGHPPHRGKNFREAIVNAMLNKIIPPKKEQNIDMFLMETALKAMSLKPLRRYFTVSNFQRALKRYIKGAASHLGSVQLSNKAMSLLEKGTQTADVKTLLRAYILFKMALRLWTGNREAEMGRPRTEHLILKSAYESGELDLLFSFMRERTLRVDFKLQSEKEKYFLFRHKHPVISTLFSSHIVYRFLKNLDQTLIGILKNLNHVLKLLFLTLLMILPLAFYAAGAPLSYTVSFTLGSVLVVILGEFFWKKSTHKKKT